MDMLHAVLYRLLVWVRFLPEPPDPIAVHLAREGLMSKEWLRENPKVAEAAGYILIDGELPL